MSVIQNIRDKYARWAVVAIALSLIGFLLMDAFAGRTGLFSNRQTTTIGKVDGTSIEYQDFENKVQMEEKNMQARGMDVTDATRQQMIASLWDQQVNSVILKKQYNELGLSVGDKETKDILFGDNPPDDLKQQFTDPKTGVYNSIAAQQAINSILKGGNTERKDQVLQYEDALKEQRLANKYMALLANTIYFPKWFLEKRNSDNSLMAKVAYVSVPYTTVPDSAAKVTDSEIEDYVKDHERDFEQKDETRSISFVAFNAAPSSADSAAVRSQILSLKPQFDTTKDLSQFIAEQGNIIPFYDGFKPKSQIQVPAKDSIFATPKGGIYGPYLDQDNYVLAKVIDVKMMPDSAKARHILIQTNDPRSGQQLMDDSTAKKRIDSIEQAVNHGASFDSLAKKYSADKSSAEKGGLLSTPSTDYFAQGAMVKAFNDFVFNGKVGDRGVVKTEFGYHLVQILDQKGVEPNYKVAYLAKQIAASPETDNQANNAATLFAGDSRDAAAFNANFDKNLRPKGYTKLVAADIKPMDFSLNGVQGSARQMIKHVFDASKGDIVGPERVGLNYIVAVVTDVNKPGLQSANTARPVVEPILRNRKKAQQIIKNIGTPSTLEQVSAKVNQPVQNADSLRFSGGTAALGYEPKVLGAAFNPANKGKVVEPVAGTQGVYVIRVDNTSTTPVEMAALDQQSKMLEMQARQMMQYRSPIEVLKKVANIKDNRAKFY